MALNPLVPVYFGRDSKTSSDQGSLWIFSLGRLGWSTSFLAREIVLIVIRYFHMFNILWFSKISFNTDHPKWYRMAIFAILMIVSDLESPINLKISDNFETIRQKCRFSRRTEAASEFHLWAYWTDWSWSRYIWIGE